MRLILSRIPDYEVVAEITADADLLPCLRDIKPDLILLDLELAGPEPQARLEQIRDEAPDAVIVGLSGRLEPQYVETLHGLDEFISKNEPANKVLMILKKYTPSPSTSQSDETV